MNMGYTETGQGVSVKHGNFPVVARPCKHIVVNLEICPHRVGKWDCIRRAGSVLVSVKSYNGSNVAVVYHSYRQKRK